MTDEELAGIEARANAATAGPWTVDNDTDKRCQIATASAGVIADMLRVDGVFCAAARTDVPALLAEVRRLRGELQCVVAHTGHLPDADRELLAGLLASCSRVARRALDADKTLQDGVS
jgi:hypothetical protein